MSILTRFKDIMASNINAMLDRAEDPEKMIEQYLRNLNRDLGNVKSETATVMAEERRAKRLLDECEENIAKMENYAMRALEANNEADARKFLEKKASLTEEQTNLLSAYELSASNAAQMKQMHDKLVTDINDLNARKNMLKAKLSVAKTKEKMNEIGSATAASSSISAFNKMEDKVNRALDEASAMAELNEAPEDNIEDLVAKYDDSSSSSVDDELAALKAKMNKKD